MSGVRYVTAALLTAVIVVFAMQNLGSVPVAFLFWRFEASLSLIVLLPFLVGLLAGGTAGLIRGRRARQARELKAQQGLDRKLAGTREVGRHAGSPPSD